ncbi:MAG: hypothetical protein IIA41_04915 [SAR324 cluster bacterium]|nr:hypothetical protein [SAR324 cluster bacterium]
MADKSGRIQRFSAAGAFETSWRMPEWRAGTRATDQEIGPAEKVALALTFPMVLTTYYLGSPDGGVNVTGYLGSLLMAGSYLAITCFTSSLTKNQVISFVLGFFICLILVLLGWGFLQALLVNVFPVWLADAITFFSFSSHFEGFHRGLIDSRDVIYFLSIIGFMLFATVIVLEHRKAS